MTPQQIHRKTDRIKLNIDRMVYDPDLSDQDLQHLEKFYSSALRMEAGLPYAEATLEAVRIHIRSRHLMANMKNPLTDPHQGDKLSQ